MKTLFFSKHAALSILFGLCLASTVTMAYTAENTQTFSSTLHSTYKGPFVSPLINDAYNLETEKKQVEAEVKEIGNEKFELTNQFKSIQDRISAHNAYVSQLETSCIISPISLAPAWCDTSMERVRQQATHLNQREDFLRTQIREQTEVITQLDNRHDELVHQEFALEKTILESANQTGVKDTCLQEPSLEKLIDCKYDVRSY